MDPITLILTAINGLRVVLANPALGGGSSLRLEQASELLGVLGSLIAQGDDALDDLREFTEIIAAMAADGRPPTPTEWEILGARIEDARDRREAAKEALLAEEAEEEAEPTPAAEEGTTEEASEGGTEPEPGPEGPGGGTIPEEPGESGE